MERQPGCESSADFAKLLAETRAGSNEAKEKLLLPYQDVFRRWHSQKMGHPISIFHDSDVTQQVFMSAWKNFDQFHGHTAEELESRMRTIFDHERNSIFRFWHRDKRDISREVHWEPARFEARPPQSMTNPLEELIQREEKKILGQALEGLSKEEVNVILWRYFYHVPYEQIGAKINRTPNAARMFCHRAKEKLLDIINHPPPGGPAKINEAFSPVDSLTQIPALIGGAV
jgi:RNA polymerase sigma factor (sigma-70 family)